MADPADGTVGVAAPRKSLAEIEKDAIRAALVFHANDKKAAAKELGIALKTLYNKLNRYKVQDALKGIDA